MLIRPEWGPTDIAGYDVFVCSQSLEPVKEALQKAVYVRYISNKISLEYSVTFKPNRLSTEVIPMVFTVR